MGPRRITKKTTEKLVKAWRDALGCGDWHVEIHMAKIPEANESANSHFDDIRKRIDMVIDPFKDSTGKECRDGDPDRETDIVHEFIHVLEYPMYQIFEQVLETYVPKKERKMLKELYENREENVCHQIAATLVRIKRRRKL